MNTRQLPVLLTRLALPKVDSIQTIVSHNHQSLKTNHQPTAPQPKRTTKAPQPSHLEISTTTSSPFQTLFPHPLTLSTHAHLSHPPTNPPSPEPHLSSQPNKSISKPNHMRSRKATQKKGGLSAASPVYASGPQQRPAHAGTHCRGV